MAAVMSRAPGFPMGTLMSFRPKRRNLCIGGGAVWQPWLDCFTLIAHGGRPGRPSRLDSAHTVKGLTKVSGSP